MIQDCLNDLNGKRFGKLVAVRVAKVTNRKTLWLCKCDCGKTCLVRRGNLVSGHTKSCGCVKTKTLKVKATTHGKSKTRIYYIWTSMKQRCYCAKNQAYQRYGGRGIKVCNEWMDFENFYEWAIHSGYACDLSIDRIDNNDDYKPSNCRWATAKVQNENKSSNVLLTYQNETKTLSEWSEDIGIPYTTLWNRIQHLGWSIEDALSKPSRGK